MVLSLLLMNLVNGNSCVDDRWLNGLLLDDWLNGLGHVLVTRILTVNINYRPHEHGDAHARRQSLVQRSGSPWYLLQYVCFGIAEPLVQDEL